MKKTKQIHYFAKIQPTYINFITDFFSIIIIYTKIYQKCNK